MEDNWVKLEPLTELNIGVGKASAWVSPKCLKEYKVKGKLGAGTSGTVYDCGFSPNTRKRVAIKMLFTGPESNFWDEVELTRQMSDLGVGPKFIDAWEKEGVGFIATEKWDMSLLDYQDYTNNSHVPLKIVKKLGHLIDVLHNAGYVKKPNSFWPSLRFGPKLRSVLNPIY